MIERIAKVVTLLLCPFLGYGFGIAFFRIISGSAIPGNGLTFGIGFGLFFSLWLIFRRQLSIVCTFEHEITHLLFGLLFFKLPRGFKVTFSQGGHVKLTGSNFIIYLAPYFFPTVSYLLLAAGYFVPAGYLQIFSGVLGASVAFHLVSTWSELSFRQTDLQKSGRLFSLVFLPVANLLFYGSLAAFILGTPADLIRFWRTGVGESLNGLLYLFGNW